VQGYCIVAGGVMAFALWNRALGQWPASRVLLFNNLIPVSTMAWAHFCLGEPVTPTFLVALLLIALGVVLGQLVASRPLRTEPKSEPEL
jgi:drug/metabolite transporter (DMT)-like permease